MSATLISLIVAGGIAAWVYAKFQSRSGNNTRQSAIAAGVTGGLIFIFLITILSTIL